MQHFFQWTHFFHRGSCGATFVKLTVSQWPFCFSSTKVPMLSPFDTARRRLDHGHIRLEKTDLLDPIRLLATPKRTRVQARQVVANGRSSTLGNRLCRAG